ncbi:MAG: TIGR03761 family integrating conjugative element protein [Salinisphaera sp.]|nr:TIGR03761 family integrating conjugative element protein [Salinisphaera sp.]
MPAAKESLPTAHTEDQGADRNPAAQASTPQKNAEGKTPQKRPPSSVSQAVVTIPLELHSRHAQRVYNRSYETAARALYVLSVMLRVYVQERDAAQVGEMADQMIDELRQELETEIQRMEQIADENGVDLGAVQYTKPRQYAVPVSTPKVTQYLGLLRELDRFVGLMDVLWLCGVYNDTQYNNGTYQWQRRLIKLANKLRNLGQQSLALARNGTKEDEPLTEALSEGPYATGPIEDAEDATDATDPEDAADPNEADDDAAAT